MKKKLWLTLGALPLLIAPISAVSAAPTETTTNNLKEVVTLYEGQLPTINTFIDSVIEKYKDDATLKANIESVKNDLTSLFNELKANVDEPDILSEKLPKFINAFEKVSSVLSLLQLANKDEIVKEYSTDNWPNNNFESIVAKIKKIADKTISDSINQPLPAEYNKIIDQWFNFFKVVIVQIETFEKELEKKWLGSYLSRITYSMLEEVKKDWQTLQDKKDSDKKYVFEYIFDFTGKYDALLSVLNSQQVLFKVLFEKELKGKEDDAMVKDKIVKYINEIGDNDEAFVKAGGRIDLSENYDFEKAPELNAILSRAIYQRAIDEKKTDETEIARLKKQNREVKQIANQFGYMTIAFGLSLLITFVILLALLIKMTKKEIKGQTEKLQKEQENKEVKEENKEEEVIENKEVEKQEVQQEEIKPLIEEIKEPVIMEETKEEIEKPKETKSVKKPATRKTTTSTKKATSKKINKI